MNLTSNNEILWFLMLIFNFTLILLIYRFFGKTGLFAWVPISVIISNIQVLKTVELFGLTSSLGNIVYATSFLITDILAENHGKKEANKAVGIGFLALLTLTVSMNLALSFRPAPVDFAHDNMKQLFGFLPRIVFASLIAYLVSQLNDVLVYSKLKERHPESKNIWIRNNLSTILSQALDSVVFVSIAFVGLLPQMEIWEIFLSTYLLKLIVAVADTPLVYLASLWIRENRVRV